MKGSIFALICIAALCVFLSTYHLTESPPTWFDEGEITQIAMNQALYGPHVLQQIAPGVLVSAALAGTTGYTVTFPIAFFFKLFGFHLLVARLVMVVFLLLFAFGAWRLIRSETRDLALYALALVTTFAPLYGNGKNVLGEVPGLFFLLSFLILIKKIESGDRSPLTFTAAGIFLGLTVATKPPFLLILPVVALVALFSRQLLSLRNTALGFLGFLAPFLTWLYVQFGGQSFAQIYAFYSNPYAIDVSNTVLHNAILFVTKPEPLYALGLLAAWALSVALRVRKRISVSRAEWIALGFSITIYLAFLRITPHYRYFFLGEMLALLYFAPALASLWPERIPKFLMHAGLCALITFQIYTCFFDSWIASYYNHHRTRDLTEVIGALPATASIFVYQAPEIPIFLPKGMPYYQYVNPTPGVVFGADKLPLITEGTPDYVVSLTENSAQIDLSQYTEIRKFNRYSLWERR